MTDTWLSYAARFATEEVAEKLVKEGHYCLPNGDRMYYRGRRSAEGGMAFLGFLPENFDKARYEPVSVSDDKATVNVTLPVFESFFAQQGANLPLVTLILLRGGKFLAEYWILIIFVLMLSVVVCVWIVHEVELIKFFLDKLRLNVKLLREVELRNFFGRLSFLLESGVTLDEAIKLCAEASKNLVVRKILADIKFSVERGASLGSLVAKEKFPPLYVGLIVTGEAGGELVNMLRQCESMADFEVEEILRTLPAKAEIFGTLLAGLIVATLVFAVMLPILDVSNLL